VQGGRRHIQGILGQRFIELITGRRTPIQDARQDHDDEQSMTFAQQQRGIPGIAAD
jgi:hypothetical protein